jgi:hypothetical protein
MQCRVTDIFPVTASAGTSVLIVVAVLADTVAARSNWNSTMFCAGEVLKFVPVIVTGVPIGPDAGVNEVIVCNCSSLHRETKGEC